MSEKKLNKSSLLDFILKPFASKKKEKKDEEWIATWIRG